MIRHRPIQAAMRNHAFALVCLAVLAGCQDSTQSKPPSATLTTQPAAVQQPSDSEIEAMIDELATVRHGGLGYMPSLTGFDFLPVMGHDEMGPLLWGQPRPEPSSLLRQLVACGAKSVPHLVAHLDDHKQTRVTVATGSPGMVQILWPREYDYNRRTRQGPPQDVNLEEMYRETGAPSWLAIHSPDLRAPAKRVSEYRVTIGDLCFVALGQIVNRRFSAVRYQPSGFIMINAPTVSPELLAAARGEWASLTPESHRESLLRDIRLPDHFSRRETAMVRLIYYYPNAAERPALEELAIPMYCVFSVEQFARGKLYASNDPAHWDVLFDEFVRANGPAFREGLLHQLLDDYRSDESGPQPPAYKGSPKKIVARLYPTVDPKHPPYPQFVDLGDQARFVDALSGAESMTIDGAVYKLFSTVRDKRFLPDSSDYLALSCMRRLAGKGHDTEFAAFCNLRIRQGSVHSAALREVLKQIWHR